MDAAGGLGRVLLVAVVVAERESPRQVDAFSLFVHEAPEVVPLAMELHGRWAKWLKQVWCSIEKVVKLVSLFFCVLKFVVGIVACLGLLKTDIEYVPKLSSSVTKAHQPSHIEKMSTNLY